MGYKIPHSNTLGGTYSTGNYLPAVTSKGNGSQANVEFYVTRAGTFSGLSVYSDTANGTGATTIAFRKNGVDQTMAVTFPVSTTGLQQDNVNSVSVSVGDLICLRLTTASGGSLGIASTVVLFESTSGDSVQFLMANNAINYTFNSLTRYFAPTGDIYTTLNTEDLAQNKIRNNTTVSDLAVYVTANSRSTSNPIRFRKNGANGNQIVTVGAGVTGLIRDTSNTDSMVVDDLFNTVITSGTGGGSFTIQNIQMTLTSSSSNKFSILGHSTWTRSMTSSAVYGHIFGGLGQAANPEASHAVVPNGIFNISKFSFYVSAHSGNRDLTAYLRGNGATLNNTFFIPQGTTGWFEDTTHTDTTTTTLRLNMFVNNPSSTGSGSMTVRSVSALGEFPTQLRIIMS